jgi:hypothetical protein
MTDAAAVTASTPTVEAGEGRGAGAFVAVWLPSLVTIIATGACLFAISWWLTQTPGGGANLGLIIGLSSVVSLSTVVVLSGPLDRADRLRSTRNLLLVFGIPLVALVLLFGVAPTGLAIVAVGVCYCLVSTTESLYLAVTETTCADLAPAVWPSTRVALLTMIHTQVERVVAPLVTGFLLAAGAVRVVPAGAIAIVAVIVAVVYLGRRHYTVVTQRLRASGDPAAGPSPTGGPLRALGRDAVAAFRLIRGRRDLVFLVQLGILANLVVFPFYAVLPAFLAELTATPQDLALWFGRAAAAYGVGMLGGTLLLMRYRTNPDDIRPLGLATGAFGLICLVLLAATVTDTALLVTVAMGLTGALFSVLVAVGGAVWLNRTPAELRVRVFSLRRLTVYSSIPLGTMAMGVGGSLLGYRLFDRVLLGAVLLALAVIWLRFRRSAAAADTAEPAREESVAD